MSNRRPTTEAAKQDEDPNRDACVLFAGVLDIRNFTELTASVDQLIDAPLPRRTRVKLFYEFKDYIEKTQSRVLQVIRQYAPGTSTYAIKPTGDGLLIAVKIEDLEPFEEEEEEVRGLSGDESGRDDDSGSGSRKSIVIDELNPARCMKKISPLLAAFGHLIEDCHIPAGPKSRQALQKGTIAFETQKFLTGWGEKLGFPLDGIEDWNFRIAAGAALGVGAFVLFSDPNFGAGESWPSDPCRQVDANGHVVNVAFRLCSRAIRLPDLRDGEQTPELLLHRRLGQIMLAADGGRGGPLAETEPGPKWPFEGKRLEICRFQQKLKGVEDSWCYGVRLGKTTGSGKPSPA